MKDITILFVEDNEEQVLLITKALNRNNNVGQVIQFSSGREVLSFLLGLADYNLPGEKYVLLLGSLTRNISGLEVLKIVKNHHALKSLPVIMYSSTADSRIADLCYQYGCNAFIHKPLHLNEIENLSALDFMPAMQVPTIPANNISKIILGECK